MSGFYPYDGDASAVPGAGSTGGTLTLDFDAVFTGKMSVNSLVNASDDAAAATAGVGLNEFYRNGSQVMVRIT